MLLASGFVGTHSPCTFHMWWVSLLWRLLVCQALGEQGRDAEEEAGKGRASWFSPGCDPSTRALTGEPLQLSKPCAKRSHQAGLLMFPEFSINMSPHGYQ